MGKCDGSSPLARNSDHHWPCHVLGALRAVLMGPPSTSFLTPCPCWCCPSSGTTASGLGEQWPVPVGITPEQSDALEGALCPAGRGGDAHHCPLSCPSHLSQDLRGDPRSRAWHSLGNAGPGATGMALFGDIGCLCHQGGQHRAGLVPDPGGREACPDLLVQWPWLRGPNVTDVTSKGKR